MSDRPTPHTARLADALTAEPYQSGKPVAVSRLVKYNFPAEHSLPLTEEVDASAAGKLARLNLGSMVAVNFATIMNSAGKKHERIMNKKRDAAAI